jgi:hypothetical protein
MDYYYIVASLPGIELGSAPPISKQDFLLNCRGVLSEEEYLEVEALLEDRYDQCSSGIACDIYSAETQLRNAIARIRAQKKGIDPRGHMREHAGFNAWIEKLVVDAFARENPRERLLGLDHARWHIADELAGVEPFSFGKVLAFAIKLRIATRWFELDKERGAERIEQFIDAQTEEGDKD